MKLGQPIQSFSCLPAFCVPGIVGWLMWLILSCSVCLCTDPTNLTRAEPWLPPKSHLLPLSQRDKARWHQPGFRVSLSAQLLVLRDLWDIQQLGLVCGAGSLLRDEEPCSPRWFLGCHSRVMQAHREEQGCAGDKSPNFLGRRADSRGMNAKNEKTLWERSLVLSLPFGLHKTVERWFPALPKCYRPKQFL